MEVAFHEPHNRNTYTTSKEAIRLPFLKENRRTEMWRSMFLYRTEKPEEKDPMFGNFYLECDIEDFKKNKEVMLEVAHYLQKEFKIPAIALDFFYTNRSIWVSVPAKVFSSFGSIKLNLIYKKMAENVQEHLQTNGYEKALDLSIYKWNGLIHSLGSFLKKSNRWVTKFSLSDLEDAVSEEDIINAPYDNFSNLQDISGIEEAKEWYQFARNFVLYNEHKKAQAISTDPTNTRRRPCMEKLEEIGTIEVDRNLHIYSYSLYLKEQGYTTNEAIEKVQSVFDISYVNLKECHRTVKSAIEGTKHFNCTVVRQLLNPELFDCESCLVKKDIDKPTFIVPRAFIKKLQKGNAHYDTYKYLLQILKEQQESKQEYIHSFKGEKHKKLVISRFKKLEELNLATIRVEKNELVCKLIFVDKEIYKSHIVIPKSFLNDIRFKEMKSEIKVLMELWRSSLLTGKEKKSLFFNVKLDTLRKQLKMSFTQLMKHFYILKKKRMVFGNRLFIFFSKKEMKHKIHSIINKVKERIHKADNSFLQEESNEDGFSIVYVEKNSAENSNQLEIYTSGLLSIV
jgi:hypothetical protein